MTVPAGNVPAVALDPSTAVARYIKAGFNTAALPALAELKALLALSAVDRFAWAKAAAAAFDTQLGVDTSAGANRYTIADVGTPPDQNISGEAEAFLAEICQGFPYVGKWNWTREPSEDTPALDAPKIVSAVPAVLGVAGQPAESPAVVTVQTHQGFIEHVGEDLHAAIERAMEWIGRETRAIRAAL